MSDTQRVIIGVAWYRKDQWPHLLASAADAADLEETYEQWVAYAERTVADLAADGRNVRKVPIDVVELVRWCANRRIPNDGNARSQYVIECTRQGHAGGDSVD